MTAANMVERSDSFTGLDQPLKQAFVSLIELGLKDGVAPIHKFENCWERQIGEQWWIAMNGHREERECSHGVKVPPFHVYLEYNGWPAGFLNAFEGMIAAGAVANEDAFITAIEVELGGKS